MVARVVAMAVFSLFVNRPYVAHPLSINEKQPFTSLLRMKEKMDRPHWVHCARAGRRRRFVVRRPTQTMKNRQKEVYLNRCVGVALRDAFTTTVEML